MCPQKHTTAEGMDSNALVKEKSMHVFMIWDNCITCIALVYNLVHGDVLSSNACSTTLGLRLGILLVACLPESSPSECHTTKCINIEINQNGQNPAPVHVLSPPNNETFEHPKISCRIFSIDKAIKLRCWKCQVTFFAYHLPVTPIYLENYLRFGERKVICFPNLLW